jgi:hypothetical protein
MLDVVVHFRVFAIQPSNPDRAAYPACKLGRDERPQFLELGSIDDCVEHQQALGSGRKVDPKGSLIGIIRKDVDGESTPPLRNQMNQPQSSWFVWTLV